MTGTTRTGVLRRTAARMATMALQGMRPGWDAAAAAALASRLVGGVGLPAVLRAGGDAGSEGGRAVLVRSLHASMRSSCPSCPLLAHSRPRSSRLYGRILTPPRSSAPSTVWRAAVRWLEKWPQNKKNNIVLCVPPSQVCCSGRGRHHRGDDLCAASSAAAARAAGAVQANGAVQRGCVSIMCTDSGGGGGY